MNVTALPYTPFWEEEKGPNNTTLYSGMDYYTLTAIASALNFTFRVLPTSSWAEVMPAGATQTSLYCHAWRLVPSSMTPDPCRRDLERLISVAT